MDELQASIMIDGQVIAGALKDFDGSLEDMILESWRLAERHATFAHSENLKQRAGLAGVLLVLREQERHDDYERVEQELDFWKAMTAAQSGIPVDFGALLASFDAEKAIGLSKLWNQFKSEATDGEAESA